MINSRTTHWHQKNTSKGRLAKRLSVRGLTALQFTGKKVNKLLQTLTKANMSYTTNYCNSMFGFCCVLKSAQNSQFHTIKMAWTVHYLKQRHEKNATNRFEQNYYKLMNNSVYGKTIESKQRRLKIDITRDAGKTSKFKSKFKFDKFKRFGENMAAICSRPKVIKWQHQLLSGRPSWIIQNYVNTVSTMMLCAQIFGAHLCTLIPTAYCIKSRRLTSMPTWQRRGSL